MLLLCVGCISFVGFVSFVAELARWQTALRRQVGTLLLCLASCDRQNIVAGKLPVSQQL
jgi:hypothetical protein